MKRRVEIMIVEDEKLAGKAIKDSMKKRGFSGAAWFPQRPVS